MNYVPKWLSIVLLSLLGLLILVVGANQVSTFIKNNKTVGSRTITITAEGKITASPDEAIVSTSIVSNGSTAESVQSDLDSKASKLVAYLKSSSIANSDISTSDYSLYPQYSNPSDYTKITGYSGSETLTAKIHDLTKVGTILGGLTANGSNQIQSVSYTFSDPDSLKEQARQQALSSARQKAEQLASAAGVKLGTLVTFTDENSTTPTPIAYPMAAAMGGAGGADVSSAASTVPSGSQDIIEDVSVTYQLK